MSMKRLADEAIKYLNNRMDTHVNSMCATEEEVYMAAMTCRIEELESALEDAKLFANVVECWGRTDCEIYKHELKATADLSINRINKVLDPS
jgi:hypothetical protein